MSTYDLLEFDCVKPLDRFCARLLINIPALLAHARDNDRTGYHTPRSTELKCRALHGWSYETIIELVETIRYALDSNTSNSFTRSLLEFYKQYGFLAFMDDWKKVFVFAKDDFLQFESWLKKCDELGFSTGPTVREVLNDDDYE